MEGGIRIGRPDCVMDAQGPARGRRGRPVRVPARHLDPPLPHLAVLRGSRRLLHAGLRVGFRAAPLPRPAREQLPRHDLPVLGRRQGLRLGPDGAGLRGGCGLRGRVRHRHAALEPPAARPVPARGDRLRVIPELLPGPGLSQRDPEGLARPDVHDAGADDRRRLADPRGPGRLGVRARRRPSRSAPRSSCSPRRWSSASPGATTERARAGRPARR